MPGLVPGIPAVPFRLLPGTPESLADLAHYRLIGFDRETALIRAGFGMGPAKPRFRG